MAQLTHVPKFGNWDGENIPYTTYFEMTRREKDAGSKSYNPNDPEENPQAFNRGSFAKDHQHSEKRRYHTPTDHHAVKQHHKKHHRREDGEFQGYMEAPLSHRSTFQQVNMGPQGRRNSGSSVSVRSSDRSNSNNSFLQPQNRQRSNKDSADHGFSSSAIPRAAPKMGSSREGEAQQNRAPSVPSFGAWDETDPESAEGFSVIFNKVKEEKLKAATKLQTLPPKPITYPAEQNDNSYASSKSKMCCCLFPAAAE